MLENLQVGDKLIRLEPSPNGMGGAALTKITRNVLGVCGEIVFLGSIENNFDYSTYTKIYLESQDWQLEKKKWVPEMFKPYWFLQSDGTPSDISWENNVYDHFKQLVGNVHPDPLSAQAYRNKLVEVMGRDGV